MIKAIPKTPLTAAFFCVFMLAGCSSDQPDAQSSATQCPAPATPIARVQGSSPVSPMLGQQLRVEGIVTLVEPGRGLYIEQPGSDSDTRTSNAIFIEADDWPETVETGSVISVKGSVAEIGRGRYSLTAITAVTELIDCEYDQALPVTRATLPLNGPGREAVEGMRIAIDDVLTVTDVYQLDRGKITLSGSGLQLVPTEVLKPGPEANQQQLQNRAYALPAQLVPTPGDADLLASGVPVEHITGVFAHDGYDLRISLQSISYAQPQSLAIPVAAATDSVRVVAMNLHNYFNGDGKGQGFPTPRGAETLDEFQQQRGRIGAAIEALGPHVIAVMELENDGFDSDSAAQDFVRLANKASGKPWAVVRPLDDNTGDDAIAVGVFYRSDRLKAIGPAQTLTGPVFEKSRQPMAQVFQQLPDGHTFLIVTNHLKSKGSCPESGENADQKDGQGCWSPMRQAAAEKMSRWATDLAMSSGTENVLILGDMNAYRNEDPINTIRESGFVELMDQNEDKTYSYVFYGQHGTLDYAFASKPLLHRVQQAFIWHVNSIWPPNRDLPRPWLRFSDHDPVVVDLSLRHSNTSD